MAADPSTALATLSDYQAAGGFNVLLPVVSLEEGSSSRSPLLVESVQVVQITPDDTYNDFRYANEKRGEYALGARALAKLAAAAGIQWVPDLCRVEDRERRPDGHVYIRFQAAGLIRQPNGEPHLEIASKEIDTADVEERLRDVYERQLAGGRAKFSEDDVPAMVRRELLALREHLLSHAETKAKNRVIRRLLTLKQVYSKQELSRPFAVPRLLYRPDMTDPLSIERTLVEGRSAAADLWDRPEPELGSGQNVEAADAEPGVGKAEGEEQAASTPALAAAPELSAGEPSPGSPPDAAAEPEAEERARAIADQATGPSGTYPSLPTDPAPPPSAPEPAPQLAAVSPEAHSMPEGLQDPVVDEGPYAGTKFSRLAIDAPHELERLTKQGSVKSRALARAWLNWAQPGLV